MANSLALPAQPKPRMSGFKAFLLLAIAVLLDLLKFMCEMLVFFAPALTGIASNVVVGGGIKGAIVGTAAAGATVVIEAFGGAAPIEALGVFLAIVVTLEGILLFSIIFIASGDFFKKGFPLVPLFIGWLIGAIPIVGGLCPSFTGSLWHTTQKLRAQDAEKRLAWQKDTESAQAQMRQQRQMQILQIRQTQAMELQDQEETQEEEITVEAERARATAQVDTPQRQNVSGQTEEEEKETEVGYRDPLTRKRAGDPIFGAITRYDAAQNDADYDSREIPERKKAA